MLASEQSHGRRTMLTITLISFRKNLAQSVPTVSSVRHMVAKYLYYNLQRRRLRHTRLVACRTVVRVPRQTLDTVLISILARKRIAGTTRCCIKRRPFNVALPRTNEKVMSYDSGCRMRRKEVESRPWRRVRHESCRLILQHLVFPSCC